MTSMNRKDIIDGLVTIIDTNASAFESVTDEVRHSFTGIGATEFPVCEVSEGPTEPGGFVTKTEQLFMMTRARVYCDSSSSDDDLRDLSEAVVDAVNADTTLGGTCVVANFAGMTQPSYWPQDSFKTIDVFFRIHYWRDIA